MWKLDLKKKKNCNDLNEHLWQGLRRTAFKAAYMKSICSISVPPKTSENITLSKRFFTNCEAMMQFFQILIKSNKHVTGQDPKVTPFLTQVTCCRNLFPQGLFKRNHHVL